MLKIRMQRIGRKHDPAFRVVVTPHTRGPKSGKYIEKVGHYHAKMGERVLNKERILHWISKGAKPSNTVHNFLITDKIIEGKKINVSNKSKVSKDTSELEAKETDEKTHDATTEKDSIPKDESTGMDVDSDANTVTEAGADTKNEVV